MYLNYRYCSKPKNGCASSICTPPPTFPDRPFRSLAYWHIASHDRQALAERITPYLAARLPSRYLIQTVAKECDWSWRTLSLGSAHTDNDSVKYWQQVLTKFWENPSRTAETFSY